VERLSVSEREELWDRWEAGESQRSISRRLGRSPSTVRTQLVSAGWNRPVPVREWSSQRLSLGEREEISRGLACGESLRCIAHRLGRAPSTVSREVKTNGGHLEYRAIVAHRASRRRAKRPKTMKLGECPRLAKAVETKLDLWWSPGQVSRWLVRAYPGDEGMRVSHETIYQSLYVQGKGALRKELWRSLRTGRATRRPQGKAKSTKGKIRDMVMIPERPATEYLQMMMNTAVSQAPRPRQTLGWMTPQTNSPKRCDDPLRPQALCAVPEAVIYWSAKGFLSCRRYRPVASVGRDSIRSPLFRVTRLVRLSKTGFMGFQQQE